MREPTEPFDQVAAIEQSFVEREAINTNFNKLREAADGVMLEFDTARENNLALRNRLIEWQVQLRVIFITRIALLKYRLRLPGFDLPEPILEAQQVFDGELAKRMEAIADRLQGNATPGEQERESLLKLIAGPVEEYRGTELDPATASRLQSLLPLCSRIESLVTSLADEIAAPEAG
jgi:multidrug resistance protein MdtO